MILSAQAVRMRKRF